MTDRLGRVGKRARASARDEVDGGAQACGTAMAVATSPWPTVQRPSK